MPGPAAPFRVVLRERNIRLLLVGLAVSQAGDWLYNLALIAFVYDRTHSSAWVGLVPANIAGIAGGALLAPLFVAWLGFSGSLVIAGFAVVAYSGLVLAQSGSPEASASPSGVRA